MKRKLSPINLGSKLLHMLLALVLTSLISNAQVRQSAFTYLNHPSLTSEQQHYADAWIKMEWVSSYEYITIDPALFKGTSISLNLPQNINLNVERNELNDRGQGVISWIGKFQNPDGDAAFVIHKDMITARISAADFVYLIYPIKGGVHVIIKCSGDKMPLDESREGYKNMIEEGIKQHQDQNTPHMDAETGTPAEAAAGDCRIRILVAYTDDADANLADPIAFVNSCIDATNIAYDNSLVSFNVELAVSIREVYAESLNSATDKTRFHDTSDGYMDDVHDYRNYFDADMCVLVTENLQSGICGEAYVVANSSYTQPFCVVTRGCAVGNLSFPHELGHLYGCRHDPYVDNSSTPYSYGHGYVYLTGHWRTIMAYNDYCVDNGSSCTRIQYFSNPAVSYSGHATGVTNANDNESALENSKANISTLELTNTNKIFVSNYTFSSGEQSDVIATNSVTNNNTNFIFNSGSAGTWRTGVYCDMKPGFWAKSGSSFKGYIASCTALRKASDQSLSELPKQINEAAQVNPNPFSDKFDVIYTLSAPGNVNIQMFNTLGEKVKDLFSQSLQLSGEYKFSFDASELRPGIYFCVIKTETGSKTIRVTKM